MSTVLVTGASGFVGRPLVDRLLARGHEVHATYVRDAGARRPGVTWHRADLLDADAAAALASRIGATHLVHLAWYAVPGRFWTALENAEWFGATLRLLNAFAEAGGRRAVVAGTCAEYRWDHDVLCEGTTPLAPATLYGACKHATHVAAQPLVRQRDVELAWARIFFAYGPGEDRRRLVASLIHGLLTGQRVLTTEGLQVRDFLHVDDVAGAFAALLDSNVCGAVNVASGQPVAVRDVVLEVARATGGLDRVDFGALPLRPDDPARVVADVARLRDEVGFAPRLQLAEGIDDTVRWWRTQLASR